MNTTTRFGVSLAVAAVLVQVACNRNSGPSDDSAVPGKTATARAGGVGASRTAQPLANTVTLPEGTQLAVRTTNILSTNSQVAGQGFTANLEEPLMHGGREIPRKAPR